MDKKRAEMLRGLKQKHVGQMKRSGKSIYENVHGYIIERWKKGHSGVKKEVYKYDEMSVISIYSELAYVLKDRVKHTNKEKEVFRIFEVYAEEAEMRGLYWYWALSDVEVLKELNEDEIKEVLKSEFGNSDWMKKEYSSVLEFFGV